MKEIDQIPDFVFSCLQKKATKEELAQLENWLDEGNHAVLYQQLQQIDQMSFDLKLYRSLNFDKARRKVLSAISPGKKLSLAKWMQKVAAILVVPLIVTCIFILYQYKITMSNRYDSSVVQEIETQPGTKTHFILPDSTEVWLNAATIIKFPSVFTGSRRLVELDGEAYFQVYKNKRKPFVVKSGSVEVEALGTAFNLCAYLEDKRFVAALEKGKISVYEKNANQQLILNPGEQVRYIEGEGQLHKSTIDVRNIVAWKDGRLVFDRTPFPDVVLTLGRWFNADIQLADPSLEDYRYTATFTSESLKQVMDLLQLTAPIEYSSESRFLIKNNQFTKEKIFIRRNPNAKFKQQP